MTTNGDWQPTLSVTIVARNLPMFDEVVNSIVVVEVVVVVVAAAAAVAVAVVVAGDVAHSTKSSLPKLQWLHCLLDLVTVAFVDRTRERSLDKRVQ